MERDLTAGSVFKTVIYFSLSYLFIFLYRTCCHTFYRHYMVWQIYL